jgi:hypothetical protein
MLQLHDHIALILLDVVMETDDAGLQLVQRIREVMQNNTTRIVLRTGQPGQAPEQEVILNYDINDYKTKTELTVQKLFTTVIASLRAYENLITIEKNRQGLAKILEGAADLYQMFSLKEFASGVLKQISAILDVGTDGILCVESTPDMTGGRSWKSWLLRVPMKPCSKAAAWTTVARRLLERISASAICLTPPWPLDDVERNLLEVFCNQPTQHSPGSHRGGTGSAGRIPRHGYRGTRAARTETDPCHCQ